jgi:hypothetical protein
MSRYYFDTHDGSNFSYDQYGVECGMQELRNQAIRSLRDMADEELPDGPYHRFWIKVRDADGKYVFEASLELKSGWVSRDTEEAG